MATEVLTPGSTDVVGANQTLADGARATVFLTSTYGTSLPQAGGLSIQFQRADNSWIDAYALNTTKGVIQFFGPVTWRVARTAGNIASNFGAEVNVTAAAGGGGGGNVTVTNFPATQAVSAASLPLPTGASTSALQTTGNSSLNSIDTKTPALSTGATPVETIKQPLVARQVPVTATSNPQQLTTTARRLSMYARGADMRYRITTATSTAVQTDHFIAAGERLDIAVGATPWVTVIADTNSASQTGTLELSELS